MITLVEGALKYKRTLLMLTLLVVISGMVTFFSISKESSPDVSIPTIYVSVNYQGVSPGDSDKLLVKPLATKLESVEGLKELRTVAAEGYAAVILEFESGTDMDQALIDTREQSRQAEAELPGDADEPAVHEINVALFPILTIALTGNVEERALARVADDLKDALTGLPGVLEINLVGKREEVVEVIVQQQQLEAYNLSIDQVAALVAANNQTVTSGSLTSGNASFPLKVDGLVEEVDQLLKLPVVSRNGEVVTLGDVAFARRSYKDPETISRVEGKPTIQLRVVKRVGGNIIETVNQAKAQVEASRELWPEGMEVTYYQDQSNFIRNNLSSLLNNVIFASLLVMTVIILILGPVNALIVGLAIPSIFLAAIMMLGLMGFTLNMVVLFALIMSVGMIVDGSIVVTEYADKRMLEGMPRPQAYARAGKLMAKPIFGSTITTLAVFAPLLFWPDIIGDFMQYIPITVILTLSAALIANILVIPSIGSLVGRPGGSRSGSMQVYHFTHREIDKHGLTGFTGFYVRAMDFLLHYPLRTILGIVLLSVGVVYAYGVFGKGVVFFPENEPEQVLLDVRGRGDMSIYQKNRLVSQVERIALDYKEVKVVSTTVYDKPPRDNASVDTIGLIGLEMADWQLRPPAEETIGDMLARANAIPGLVVQSQKEQFGPPSPADLVVEFAGENQAALETTMDRFKRELLGDNAFTEITDTRPLDGIDFAVDIDREEAARFGVSVAGIGRTIKLLTNGAKIGEFIADDADKKIDILLRLPQSSRTIDAIEGLRIQTERGLAPLSRFVNFHPRPREGSIERVNGRVFYRLLADVKPGSDKPASISRAIETFRQLETEKGVTWKLRGEQEDQEETAAFLSKAFGVAFFVLLVILITQFNSFYQAALILSAIIFSIFGVFIGLMLRGEAFGIVMSGVGVIALSGIVVNNNIILIDFYNFLRREGVGARHAILSVCADRLRPVLLTSFTTCVGLAPMVSQLNLDIINRGVEIGAPTAQIWVQLATAISGGLAFATILTLVMTPCLLYLRERRSEKTMPGLDSAPIAGS